MVDHPEQLQDLAFWVALMIGFGAFTRAVQLMVGWLQPLVFDELAETLANAPGFNSPLEPSWQSRNIVVLAVLSVIYLGVCLYTLSWLTGLALALLSVAGVLSLARLLFVLPTSALLTRLIERDLERRLRLAREQGDESTAEAAAWALERLSVL